MPSRLTRHDEFGHVHFLTFSCFARLQFFRHASVFDAFVRAMDATRGRLAIRWLGYVVMPEHVHLLVLPQSTGSQDVVPISTVLRELKSGSGRKCKAALRGVWREKRTLGTDALDDWATGEGPKPFWKPRGYDRKITSEAGVIETMNYIHANPIRRGLVERPDQWLWSSFRFYEHGDASKIAMDWDGGFPIA